MRTPKTRIIFNSYNKEDDYEPAAKDHLMSLTLLYNQELEISDDLVQAEIEDMISADYERESAQLDNHFDGMDIIVKGSCGRWNGTTSGIEIFGTWNKFIAEMGKDCDYFKIWDQNGKLFVQCSHHDGTNNFEVRVLTKAGEMFYDDWCYNDDSRAAKLSRKDFLDKMFNSNHLTKRPHFMHKVYGCPMQEYEKKEETVCQ